ncbi:Anaerobic regulatory protein [Methylobacterium cerastii]|uniref:Anaerobic regulatory protein n=1 Tax=Methylobacterium cerastii TaxID=932741 RepID=A0ABQ4QI08_9HYPH|nr:MULTISPECIES: Crp/Fnr family transcriptional regulator [Methylobacterium]TXN81514.1 Crp/Fnr family transcriptional regulator [Methylobacterium sp. WL8]GJD44878.1 Anaerobic regulatory protein [Methylobacterium cerastii]
MLSPLIQKLEGRFTLSESDRSALRSASCRGRRVRPRTDLAWEGDLSDHVQMIRSGFACRYKVLAAGTRSIVAYVIPGDICDLNVAILGAVDHSIGTIDACEVVSIPRQVLDDLTGNHPTLNRALRWASLVDEAIQREWLVNMGRHTAERQVAHLLCEFLWRLQAVGLAGRDGYELPLRQSDLGDATGMSSVHVNRTLQKLRGTGLVRREGRYYSFPDVEALQAFAQFDPKYLHRSPGGVDDAPLRQH